LKGFSVQKRHILGQDNMGAQQAKETKSGKRERKTKDNRQIIQNFAQDSNGKFGADVDF
jgi:hypothetical protein